MYAQEKDNFLIVLKNIKFNKLLDDKYSLMSDIAKKYNYNDELLSMITFIYVAF